MSGSRWCRKSKQRCRKPQPFSCPLYSLCVTDTNFNTKPCRILMETPDVKDVAPTWLNHNKKTWLTWLLCDQNIPHCWLWHGQQFNALRTYPQEASQETPRATESARAIPTRLQKLNGCGFYLADGHYLHCMSNNRNSNKSFYCTSQNRLQSTLCS